jgi:hypothetical protein
MVAQVFVKKGYIEELISQCSQVDRPLKRVVFLLSPGFVGVGFDASLDQSAELRFLLVRPLCSLYCLLNCD